MCGIKKILIMGASGGIGRYLVEYFSQNARDDIQLICASRHPDNNLLTDNIIRVELDISKKEDFKKLPKDIYAVVNLAGMMPARMKGFLPQAYIDVNITGMLNILEFCKENKVDRVIYMQSFGDIKDWSETDLILHPDSVPKFDYGNDHSIYIVSKNAAIELLKCYYEMFGIKYFVFRLPTVYSWSKNDSYYVNGILRKRAWRILIDNAINGRDIEVWGNPKRKKDMLYVKDLCQMIYRSCFVDLNNGIYNAGTGIGTTLEEQISTIIEVFGDAKKSKMIFCPEKPNAPQYIMDISNAVSELGYRPKFSYRDMLIDMKKQKEKNRF